MRTDGGLYRQMDSAATCISLFRCGDARPFLGLEESKPAGICVLISLFSLDDIYIARFWGS